jgi:hypothetical protein
MKLLLRCEHGLQAHHFANVLRAAGVACEVRNLSLGGAVGDIPWLECSPQLWLRHAPDEAFARQLLAELQQPNDAPPWSCQRCNESIEAQFAACWNCGVARPAQ